jgi:hypothetical protein
MRRTDPKCPYTFGSFGRHHVAQHRKGLQILSVVLVPLLTLHELQVFHHDLQVVGVRFKPFSSRTFARQPLFDAVRLTEESLSVLTGFEVEEVDDGGLSQDEANLRLLVDELADLPGVLRLAENVLEDCRCGLLDLFGCERGGLVGYFHHPHHALGLVVIVNL